MPSQRDRTQSYKTHPLYFYSAASQEFQKAPGRNKDFCFKNPKLSEAESGKEDRVTEIQRSAFVIKNREREASLCCVRTWRVGVACYSSITEPDPKVLCLKRAPEQKHPGSERTSHRTMWKSVAGRQNSRCKGPEVGGYWCISVAARRLVRLELVQQQKGVKRWR